jgi:hypothetical protein
VIFGVFYWERELRNGVERRITDGELGRKVDNAFGLSRRDSIHWDWFRLLVDLDMPKYRNWYHEDVIRSMALNYGKQMVDDLCPLVEKVIRAGERDIDLEVARLARLGDG